MVDVECQAALVADHLEETEEVIDAECQVALVADLQEVVGDARII